MVGKSKSWTPERRAKQSELMRKMRPWEKSTGPKTPSGKEIIKNNALKHGFCSEPYRELIKLLNRQKEFIKD